MKVLCLSFLITLVFGFAKHSQHNNIKPTLQSDTILLKLKNKKKDIDQYVSKHAKSALILVKIPGKKNLVIVKNEHWPDEIEYTYNIYKNPAGKIIFIAQIPYSESGDWDIACKHYFDEQGKTFAFYRQESIFNDDVKGGIVREVLLNYYDREFRAIIHSDAIADKAFHPIKKNKTDFDFRNYEYQIYKNVNECLSGYHVQLTN